MKEDTTKEATTDNAETFATETAVEVEAPKNIRAAHKRRRKKKGPVDGPRHPLTGNF